MAASRSLFFLMQSSLPGVPSQQQRMDSIADYTKDLPCLEGCCITSITTTASRVICGTSHRPNIIDDEKRGLKELNVASSSSSSLPRKGNSGNVACSSKAIQLADCYTHDRIPLHVHEHIIMEPHFMAFDCDDGSSMRKSSLTSVVSSIPIRHHKAKLRACNEYECGLIDVVESPIHPVPDILLATPAHFQDMLELVRRGLDAGHSPELAIDGSGGVYFMKHEDGLQNVAVFKPMDEEPMCVNNPKGYTTTTTTTNTSSNPFMWMEGLKKGTKTGEGAIKEVAAYILDQCSGPPPLIQGEYYKDKEGLGFCGVPPTIMARVYHEVFHYNGIKATTTSTTSTSTSTTTTTKDARMKSLKLGSLQRFVGAIGSCEDMSPSLFSVREVHKITVLDLRLANTDRHGGNILVSRRNDGEFKLVPIDHGYCLPDKFGECTFEWLYWPQASQPYDASTLEYIEALDAERDIGLLKRCGWTSLRSQCARVLRIATMVLKKGASAGFTPFQIGSILSCNRYSSVDAYKAPIELILEKAHDIITHSPCPGGTSEAQFMDILEDLLDDHIAKLKTLG